MSDLYGTSQLAAPSDLAAPSGIDATAIDKNLRQIKTVQANWRLPQLPETVALDLAAQPGVTHQQVGQFLRGIDTDLHYQAPEEGSKFVLPDGAGIGETPQQRSFMEDIRSGWAGLAGLPEPTKLAENGSDPVVAWKREAVKNGFLDPPTNGLIDGSWSPELNSIRKDMIYNDLDNHFRGDRTGATTFSTAMQTMGKWTSPSGLMRAAVDLDLWWDAGQIGKEFSSWGDKWHNLTKSKNPFEFGKNFLDAATGPIDDIVVPALNLALLFVGVGEAMNFGRLALFAEKGLTGARAVEGLYDGARLTKFGKSGLEVANEIDRFKDASWLADRFRNAGTFGESIAGKMDAWRAWSPVGVSKKVVQTGMKLGLASQAEDQFLPSYKGYGLGDIEGVKTRADHLASNPLVWGLGEALFTPYHVFSPGTFVGGTKKLASGLLTAAGSTAGRAAIGGALGGAIGSYSGNAIEGAAIGAVGGAVAPQAGTALKGVAGALGVAHLDTSSKFIGHVGDFLQLSSFKPIADSEGISVAFHNGLKSTLEGDSLVQYEDDFRRYGGRKAMANLISGGDEEAAAAGMGFVTVQASLDHTASVQAGARGSKGWQDRYHLAKNKLVAQLRVFDPADIDSIAYYRATMESQIPGRGIRKRYNMIRKELAADPEKAATLVDMHNRMAEQTLRQLLSPENLPDVDVTGLGLTGWTDQAPKARLGVIEAYLPQVMPTFGNWPRFAERSEGLHGLVNDGLLDLAEYAPALSAQGHRKNLMAELAAKRLKEQPMPGRGWSKNITNHVFLDPDFNIQSWNETGIFSPLARAIDPGVGKMTVMRAESVTKQELLTLTDNLGDHIRAFEAYGTISRKSNLKQAATSILSDVESTWSRAKISEALAEAGMKGSNPQNFQKLQRYMVQHGIKNFTDFEGAFNEGIGNVLQDQSWVQRYDMASILTGEDGSVLDGLAALKARRKAVASKLHQTAAEIDTGKLLKRLEVEHGVDSAQVKRVRDYVEGAERDGYKLVHGVEFLGPEEIQHTTPMFRDITARHMNAVTLGNFFGRKQPEEARRLYETAVHNGIADHVSQLHNDGDLVIRDADGAVDPFSPDIQALKNKLYADVLNPQMEEGAGMINDMRNQSWLQRRVTGAKSAGYPVSLTDLGLGVHEGRVVEALTPVYGEEVARAVWRGLKDSRHREFKDFGLYSIETHFRKNNQLAGALKALSGTKAGEGFMANTRGTRRLGAVVGGVVGAQDDENPIEGALKGALVGAAAGTALPTLLKPVLTHGPGGALLNKLDHGSWQRYGYMADNLARVRDTMRFSLSPMFDVQRYVKGSLLSAIDTPTRLESGERVAIRINNSPKALEKSLARRSIKDGMGEVEARAKARSTVEKAVSDYKEAAKTYGKGFDPDAVETTGRYFNQVGMMGFNPNERGAVAFYRMQEAGLKPETAWKAAKKIYTYGVTGRSPAEMSVNFIFFPFSFEKKIISHSAAFLADDLSRAAMVHDAYKTYEILNEKYDLNMWMEEHMPALRQLESLNAFSHGIGLGTFGGINRPFENFAGATILNLFSPHGVSIQNMADADNLKRVINSTLPAWNDVDYLLKDAKEQGHVVFSPTHQTRFAEAGAGYQEWNDYKTAVTKLLAEKGYKFSELARKDVLAPLYAAYKAKRAELDERYPGFVESKIRTTQKQTALQIEKQDRMARAETDPANASQQDIEFYQFETGLQALKSRLADLGIDNWEDMPPDMFTSIRGIALDMARQDPKWKLLYKKYYEPILGHLELKI